MQAGREGIVDTLECLWKRCDARVPKDVRRALATQ